MKTPLFSDCSWSTDDDFIERSTYYVTGNEVSVFPGEQQDPPDATTLTNHDISSMDDDLIQSRYAYYDRDKKVWIFPYDRKASKPIAKIAGPPPITSMATTTPQPKDKTTTLDSALAIMMEPPRRRLDEARLPPHGSIPPAHGIGMPLSACVPMMIATKPKPVDEEAKSTMEEKLKE